MMTNGGISMKRSTFTMRRLLALVLVLIMVGSLFAGCGKKTNDPTVPSEPNETIAGTAAPTDEPTVAPTQAPTEAPTEPAPTVPPVLMGTVNADNLNVRSEPYSTADILKRLAINTRIEILEQKIVDGVNWGRIAEGWVNLNYVTIGVEFPEPGTNNGSGSVTTNNTTEGVVTTGLNIRKDSNANAERVGSYAKGDKMDEPRVSIRARVCADCIEAAGEDRVIFMDEGRILEQNTPEEFFANPQTDRAKEFLSKVL